MAFCSKCGAQVEEGTVFCAKCGQPLNEEAHANAPVNEPVLTTEYKAMAALSYLGLLLLIPLIAKKDSKYVRFHVNQGLVLFIADIAVSILIKTFKLIPVLGNIASIVLSIAGIAVLVLSIMGIVYAAKGEYKSLPVVGSFKIL